MIPLSMSLVLLWPAPFDHKLGRDQVRESIVCGIQYNHATSECTLIVANKNSFAVGDVRVEVELGSPDNVIERKSIVIKKIKGKRFHTEMFKPKDHLGAVAIVEAKAFAAVAISKKKTRKPAKSTKRQEENTKLRDDLKVARLRLDEAHQSLNSIREIVTNRCKNESRRHFLLYIKELDEVLRENGFSGEQVTQVYLLIQLAVERFKGNRAERAAFVREAEDWLEEKTQTFWKQAERERQVLEEKIRSNPKTVVELLAGKDAATSAKIKASLLGRSVSWGGTVTEVVTNMFYDHELELSCGGIKVEVDLLDGRRSLPQMGQDIKVYGTIDSIEDYGVFGCTIRLSRCRIRGP